MRQIRWLLALVLVTILGSAAACGGENPILPEQTAAVTVTPTFTEEGGPDCTHLNGSTVCTDIGAGGHWTGCPIHSAADHTEYLGPFPPMPFENKVHNMAWAAYNCTGGWVPNL